MIICNLSVLLAERQLKMSDVIQKTGIAKTTIRALYYNQSQGIQYATIDALCKLLNVTPEQLLLYEPLEYSFTIKDHVTNAEMPNPVRIKLEMDLEYKYNKISEVFIIDLLFISDGRMVGFEDNKIIETIHALLDISDSLKSIFQKLSKPFWLKIQNEFVECIRSTIDIQNDVPITVSMPDRF